MSVQGPVRKAEVTRDDWQTPPELFEPLEREFRFDIDGAANAENRLAPYWLGPGSPLAEDALTWDPNEAAYSNIFCNPPYGDLMPWVEAFVRWHHAGHGVVALLPANTDEQWFGRIVDTANEVRLLVKRVSFVRPDGGRGANTGGSLVAIWRPGPWPRAPHIWAWRWR